MIAAPPFTPSVPRALPKPLNVLGIRFHAICLTHALDFVQSWLLSPVCRQVVFANAHTISVGWRDGGLRQALDQSDLTLADGMSIVWGSRWIGVRLPGRVPGPDFTTALCARAATHGYRVFFMGSTETTLAQLKESLERQWPGLQIVGTYSPPMRDSFSDQETRDILEAVRAAKPDILFVGMSMPKQEKWIAQVKAQLPVPVAIGVGAAFDFLSGRVKRAPVHLQAMGLEWVYRLWCEPRRLWKRYLLGNAIFLTHLAWAVLRHQLTLRKH